MKRLVHDEHASAIDRLRVWIEIIQGLVTILALVAGGYWFVLQRSTKAQVKIDQTVTQRPAADHPDQTLITIDVRATNIGKVKVVLSAGALDLMQINPTPGKPLISFELKELTLEPGESDQAIFRTLKVQSTVKTIQVHSEYPVPGEKNKYWNLLSGVDIGARADHREAASSVH